MAEALFRELWRRENPGWEITVRSAGTGAFPGLPATEHAVSVMRRRGGSLDGHRSKGVTHDLLEEADLVLTMTGAHKEFIVRMWPEHSSRVFALKEFLGDRGDIGDPFGGTHLQYEETAAALEQMLRSLIHRIRREGTP